MLYYAECADTNALLVQDITRSGTADDQRILRKGGLMPFLEIGAWPAGGGQDWHIIGRGGGEGPQQIGGLQIGHMTS